MKDRKIWLIILLILVGGVIVTRYTSSYVQRQEKQAAITSEMIDRETIPATVQSSAAGGGRAAESTSEMTGAAALPALPQAAAAFSEDRGPISAASPAEALSVEEAAPAQTETAVSPLEGVRGRSGGAAVQGTDYRQLLSNLDSQIQRSRTQERDTTAYSLKTAAESELSLWEDEMNTIYNTLLERLSKEDGDALALEQQEWIRSRESRAVEMNAGNSQNSLEGVNLTVNMASLTRERAYELADRCQALIGAGQ